MFNQNQLHNLEAGAPKAPAPAPEAVGDKASIDNTDIYYMPENFQKSNVVAGKNTNIKGVWVLVITIFILIALGGGLFMYWSQSGFISGLFSPSTPEAVVTPLPETETPASLNPTPTATPAGSPREIYLAFRSELAQVTTVDAYLAVYSKYASADYFSKLSERKRELEADTTVPAELLAALRGTMLPSLDGTEDISEVTADGRSTLTVKKTNDRESGTVVFVSESNAWRISDEIWQTSAAAVTPVENTPVVDEDNDGLSNLEEAAIGTNAKASDTDGDTFGDLEELNNGYNPAGAGKISDNKNLATYLNTTFNFSLIYPTEWERTIATTDDSIILTAPDKQFIQVLIQPNTDREAISNWYKKTFTVENIDAAQLFTSVDWEGVRTTDNLTTYLTNKDKSYIFVVTYNLGANKSINYRHIYETVLRSLKLAA